MEQTTERAGEIARLNDAFRATFVGGRVFLTQGVAALDERTSHLLLNGVRTAQPDPGDDPWGERDFGTLDITGIRFFWKIDYYALDSEALSPDPADPAVTRRVLTIMRADEY